MCESLRTVIGLSPPGTRPDCFRHYELLTAGDIVVMIEHPNGTHSLHTILADLPVAYVSEARAGAASAARGSSRKCAVSRPGRDSRTRS